MVKFKDNSKMIKEQLNEQIKKALNEIGNTAETIAKDNAPVDTGNLRAKITNTISVKEKIARIGTNAEYAVFQEYGTSKMEAQPFIRPARDEMQGKVDDIVARYLKEVGK